MIASHSIASHSSFLTQAKERKKERKKRPIRTHPSWQWKEPNRIEENKVLDERTNGRACECLGSFIYLDAVRQSTINNASVCDEDRMILLFLDFTSIYPIAHFHLIASSSSKSFVNVLMIASMRHGVDEEEEELNTTVLNGSSFFNLLLFWLRFLSFLAVGSSSSYPSLNWMPKQCSCVIIVVVNRYVILSRLSSCFYRCHYIDDI